MAKFKRNIFTTFVGAFVCMLAATMMVAMPTLRASAAEAPVDLSYSWHAEGGTVTSLGGAGAPSATTEPSYQGNRVTFTPNEGETDGVLYFNGLVDPTLPMYLYMDNAVGTPDMNGFAIAYEDPDDPTKQLTFISTLIGEKSTLADDPTGFQVAHTVALTDQLELEKVDDQYWTGSFMKIAGTDQFTMGTQNGTSYDSAGWRLWYNGTFSRYGMLYNGGTELTFADGSLRYNPSTPIATVTDAAYLEASSKDLPDGEIKARYTSEHVAKLFSGKVKMKFMFFGITAPSVSFHIRGMDGSWMEGGAYPGHFINKDAPIAEQSMTTLYAGQTYAIDELVKLYGLAPYQSAFHTSLDGKYYGYFWFQNGFYFHPSDTVTAGEAGSTLSFEGWTTDGALNSARKQYTFEVIALPTDGEKVIVAGADTFTAFSDFVDTETGYREFYELYTAGADTSTDTSIATGDGYDFASVGDYDLYITLKTEQRHLFGDGNNSPQADNFGKTFSPEGWNYTWKLSIRAQDIEAPVITINGAATINVPYGACADVDPGATATDNFDSTLIVSSDWATVITDTTAIGTYTVTYTVADIAGNEAVPVTRTVNIQGTPVITAEAEQSATYDGTAKAVVATIDNGLTLTVTYYKSEADRTAGTNGTTTAPTDAGTYYVKAAFGGNTNFAAVEQNITFTVAQKTPVITAEAEQSATYDGTSKAVVATLDNGLTLTVTYYNSEADRTAGTNGTTTAPTDAGTYYVKATFGGNTNFAAVEQNITFTVAQKTPVITAEAEQSATYDGTSKAVVATIDNGLTLTITYYKSEADRTAGTNGTTTAPTDAGTYYVKAAFGGNTNFVAMKQNITFTVQDIEKKSGCKSEMSGVNGFIGLMCLIAFTFVTIVVFARKKNDSTGK